MAVGLYLSLLSVTAAAAVWDVRTGKIPNRLTYTAVLVGLVGWPIAGAVQGDAALAAQWAGRAWVGMLCGLVPFAVLVLTAGLGGGDMKLMAAVGAISASWEMVLAVSLYAVLVAAGMAVVVMVRRRAVKQTLGRIAGALLMASARVKPTLPDASRTHTVPFAAAVAVGVAVAGAEQLLGWVSPWSAYGP